MTASTNTAGTPLDKPTNVSKPTTNLVPMVLSLLREKGPWERSCPTTVSEHFLTDHDTANDISLMPLELLHSNRDSGRKAREAYLITTGHALHPLGLNKKYQM